MKVPNFKNYLNKPKYCYIPKCKAQCCSNAPLPVSLVNYAKAEKIIRPIQMTIPAPDNNPYCRNAVIPITKPIDKLIVLRGKTKDGKKVFELDTEKILASTDNYCPFLTEYARCNIYDTRPKVCRDFGTDKFKCYEQVNLKELTKYKIKNFCDFHKELFKLLKNRFDNIFSSRKIK